MNLPKNLSGTNQYHSVMFLMNCIDARDIVFDSYRYVDNISMQIHFNYLKNTGNSYSKYAHLHSNKSSTHM